MTASDVLGVAVTIATVLLLISLCCLVLLPHCIVLLLRHDITSQHKSQKLLDMDSQELDWQLANEIKGRRESVIIYVRTSSGELGFRMKGRLQTSSVVLVSIFREADLLPTWNKFIDQAKVVHVATPTQLWAFADMKFWPLPIPSTYMAIHARLEDCTASAGYWRYELHSPDSNGPLAFDLTSIPTSVRKHSEVVVSKVVGMVATTENPSGVYTDFELNLVIDLRRLTFLGPLRYLTPPAWLVRIVTSVIMPSMWKSTVDIVRKLGASDAENPIAARGQPAIVQTHPRAYCSFSAESPCPSHECACSTRRRDWAIRADSAIDTPREQFQVAACQTAYTCKYRSGCIGAIEAGRACPCSRDYCDADEDPADATALVTHMIRCAACAIAHAACWQMPSECCPRLPRR